MEEEKVEEQKNQGAKKSKVPMIIVAIILVLLVAIIAVVGMFVNEFAQKQIINEEIETINKSGEVNTEIKAKGKYADVEKALKDYIVEYQNVAKQVSEKYEDQKFTTILSADNFANDGPDFKESRQLITDTKTKGDEVKTKLAEMITEEYKNKKAEEAGLTGKYKDLFIESIQLESELKKVNSTIDTVNNYLEQVENVYNFLQENVGKWEVKSNIVQFTENALVQKYNGLISLVNIAANKLKI
ncbi:MAG: hypothetical protein HFJ46_06165 [Clostridia bacterium]|nr:hypothetical protein [Clostridia bacterium]